ncbi:transketolase [Buchnera aphidicola (Thelaxes californica)]|uniref:Transketolase n=1 Tax=Buchnera aphidicola (Thelaxes californica) TaxID=1315998 RepID=A0A4D6YBZ5_9GAMM|nr:transketolase [Buchnera aphidicola]QCI26632.1 transketolase [Buchnera aphidicola (Thelaxes californica)]
MSLILKKTANALRMLSIDAIEKAQSGHPGAPMGMADIADVLWRKFLKHNPKNPKWSNRDRFILSNGHASMLLYSLLHLSGYDISIEQIKNFRKLNSITPGHPEFGHTPGVEMTTGPLGQGLANAVGVAIAERTFGAYFNRPNYSIVDHYTWVFAGDGCLMEGISHEVASLAGTLKLSKLIVFYDRNNISIDGETKGWFTEDVAKRFKAYHWNVIDNVNGHDFNNIYQAIHQAKKQQKKPSLIICDTIIGYGSPNKSGKEECHGAPLGVDEILLTKKFLNWEYEAFYVPTEIYSKWNFHDQGSKLEKNWKELFTKYSIEYPELSNEYNRRINGLLPQTWEKNSELYIQSICNLNNELSTRKASQNILEQWGKWFPELIGGSADLAPSNLTMWSGSQSIKDNISGNYIHYGVREFGMTAIANGIANYGGFIPYTATFLMFVEYARNAVRMAAMMKIKHIFIYTHDSIGLGEDGPTHQPIEQLISLRTTPNLNVWRPSDQLETAISWKSALESKYTPTALILSRQNLVPINRNSMQIKNIYKGGYVLQDFNAYPNLILISSGSELWITMCAAKILSKKGYSVRVVSMPCTNIFDVQNPTYKNLVLPKKVNKRIAIEASSSNFWYKYVGLDGVVIGIDMFGESAPAPELFKKFGFTINNIVKKSELLLNK